MKKYPVAEERYRTEGELWRQSANVRFRAKKYIEEGELVCGGRKMQLGELRFVAGRDL